MPKIMYRFKFYFRIGISDDELVLRGLAHLTSKEYIIVKDKLLHRLGILKEALQRLYIISINIKKNIYGRTRLTRISIAIKNKLGIGYAPLGLDDDHPTPEEIEEFEILDCHTKTTGFFKSRLKTRVGKAHAHRIACELWAEKQKIKVDAENDNAISQRFIPRLKYVYSLFASNSQGISKHDIPILFRKYLQLKMKPDQIIMALAVLDPNNTGYVTFDNLVNWILVGTASEHKSAYLQFTTFIQSLSFLDDAKVKILSEMLSKSRLELDVQRDAIQTMLSTTAVKSKKSKKEKKRIAEMEDRQTKLSQLNKEFNQREQLVLTRMVEDDAERKCGWFLMGSSRGRYFLSVEMELLEISQELINTFGASIGFNVFYEDGSDQQKKEIVLQLKALCASVIVNCFDTDCSGTFDEGEVTMILQCTKNNLPEKQRLFYFPAVKYGDATREEVVSYLLQSKAFEKNLFAKLRLSQSIVANIRSQYFSSKLLLISLSRQAARERCNQANQLSTTGSLSMNDDGGSIALNNRTGLLMRSQMLAVRQVKLFLETDFGTIRHVLTYRRLEVQWARTVVKEPSLSAALEYAFIVFMIPPSPLLEYNKAEHKVLNTEISHIVQFLEVRFNLSPKIESANIMSKLISLVSGGESIAWLSRVELFDILDQIFSFSVSLASKAIVISKIIKSGRLKLDATVRMLAVARQEACLIAFDFPDKHVCDTNYRCFILGLYLYMKLNSASINITFDWTSKEDVPELATLPYLLSQGFSFEDLVQLTIEYDALYEICNDAENIKPSFEILNEVSLKTFDLNTVLAAVKADVFSNFGCFQAIGWMSRVAIGGAYYYLYMKIASVIRHSKQEVNYLARVFLNEVLIGVSHSSFE